MASKPENTFRRSVHKHLPKSVYQVKMNNPFAAGVADDYYSGVGGDLWVEYKYQAYVPKSESIKLDLSALQAMWLDSRLKEGRDVHVILGCKDGGILFSNGEWNKTFTQKQLLPRIASRQSIAEWITVKATGSYANTQTPPQRGQRHKRVLSHCDNRVAAVLPHAPS